MQTLAIIIILVIAGSLLFLFLHYGIGAGRFRLDSIEKLAADKSGEGVHVFGYYSPAISQEFSSNAVQIWHIFIRFSDGKMFKVKIGERSSEISRETSGYKDGFQGFETDIWEKKGYKNSLKMLSELSDLLLDVDEKSGVKITLYDDTPPYVFYSGDNQLKICKNRESSGYIFELNGISKWKTKV